MMLEKSKRELYGDVFTSSRSARLWNDLYEAPENLFSHNMALRRDRVCQYVVDHFSPQSKILDLGCGAGVVTEQLLQKGFTVTGADRSQDMLDLTARRLSRFPKERYELKLGTCESLPFEDGQFDVILCVGVFGYIDDVVGALLEIRRVLRPGGVLLISIRNPFNTILSDPLRTARFVGRNVRKAFRTERVPARVPQDGQQADPQRPPQFRVDILQDPRPFIRGVTLCGYRLEHFSGFGFGPFAIAGKALFPSTWSIRLSDFLNGTFDRIGLRSVTRSIGDVSLYTFRKTTD